MRTPTFLLRGVRPLGGQPRDLLLRDGVVADVGEPHDRLDAPGAHVLDGDGLVALPGLVDLHTHLREPGREDAETVESGTRAAALGGFTAVHAMANTEPVADTAGVVEQVWRLGRRAGWVEVRPVGAVTVGLRGERLAELGAMADSAAGVRVFSDDGRCVADAVLMRRALEYVKAFDGVVAQHSQEPRLTEGAQMHEGEVSAVLGLTGWPAAAEEAVIARDVLLAGHVGSRLHVCHVSTAGSVEIVRWAKSRGVRVTAEVTPHHLLLTDEEVRSYDPVFKVNPPLRTAQDVQALRAALADGTVDVVATDHAPHAVEDKDCEWAAAATGMTGLETALSVVQATMVDTGLLDWAGVADADVGGARRDRPRDRSGVRPAAGRAGQPRARRPGRAARRRSGVDGDGGPEQPVPGPRAARPRGGDVLPRPADRPGRVARRPRRRAGRPRGAGGGRGVSRGTAVGLLAVLVILVWLAMLAGWRRRAARQTRELGLTSLPATPAEPGASLTEDTDGVYVSTTAAGRWLERITAYGLGARSAATHGRHRGGRDLAAPGRTGRLRARRRTRRRAPLGRHRGQGRAARRDRRRHVAAGSHRGRHRVPAAGRRPTPTGWSPRSGGSRRPRPRGAPHERGGVLVLEDGRAWRGQAYGAVGETVGEAVFATGMTGYQETLTDPSYHRQVVVMTAPHIGNTGVNDEDPESWRIWVAGYVVRDPARRASNWRARRELADELRDAGVVGISGVDTRAITRHLRERGAMRAGVFSGEAAARPVQALADVVRAAPPMTGADLAGEVTTPRAYVVPAVGERRLTVAAIDLGIKAMTPRRMAERGIEVHVLPASATLADVRAVRPDGVFFSNGPGDPAASTGPVGAAARGARAPACRSSGSASATSCSAGRSASERTSSGTATGGSTSRCWTGPRAGSR